MSPIYKQPSDPASLKPTELAASLRAIIATAQLQLQAIPSETASEPLGEGKWSTKEVIGHLIDSATNNLQRIVRLQLQPEIDLPGYEQNGWVGVQRYDLLEWQNVLTLWSTLNGQLAHIIAHVDPACLTNIWNYNDTRLTLGFIIEDYIAHMEHHLRQIGA